MPAGAMLVDSHCHKSAGPAGGPHTVQEIHVLLRVDGNEKAIPSITSNSSVGGLPAFGSAGAIDATPTLPQHLLTRR